MFLLTVLALAGCHGNASENKSNPSGSTKTSTRVSTVKAKLTSLAIKTMPTKVEYSEGEVFDPTGLVLTATYDNGTTKEIKTGFTASSDPLTADQKSVTVSYSTKSVEVTITVKALVVKGFKLSSTSASLTYATKNNIDLFGLEFIVSYDNDTEKTISVLEEGITMKDEKGKDFVNGSLGSSLGVGEHTITVSYKGFMANVVLTIVNGYKIEGEAASNEENPTADSYVKAKVNDEYVSISTGLATGNGSICGIKEDLASGGQFLGGIKAGNVIEFYFKSDSAGKADVKIAASSNWVLKMVDNKPSWTGDIQVNEIFTASANDKAIEIKDDVILPGGGSQDNTTGSYKLYRQFREVNFGVMDIQAGLNKVVISMMSADVMSNYPNNEITGKPKYQNQNNSNYGVPAIDYLRVNFQE